MLKRVVFLGNNQLAVRVLKYLTSQPQQLIGLVVHPMEKAKHKNKLLQLAKLPKTRIFQGDVINDSETIKQIKALEPDLLVSVMFGYILKQEILSVPKYGAVNLHPAYLPFNRGAHPNVWSIMDETPVGVTLHMIDEKVDRGKILTQRRIEILPTDTGKSLYQRLENEAYNLFIATWPKLVTGEIKPRRQSGQGSWHQVKDLAQLDEIDLDKKYTGRELINMLRARTFPPYKGAYFKAEGKKILVRVKLDFDGG